MVVLYEDNHSIAVVKPHGMLTQSDDTGDISLFEEVKAFIKERDSKPGNVYLGLLHRLDRPVGGIVLFGKTSKGAGRLSLQFRDRTIKKIYVALVEGVMDSDEGVVRHWVVKNESTNKVSVTTPDTVGAKEAVSSWRVIERRSNRTLVEVHIQTGRPHQIRVALSSLGHPVVGDLKYGASKGHGEAIALFSAHIEFRQAITGEVVSVSAKYTHPIFESA